MSESLGTVEKRRLEALANYSILDTSPEESFDAIASLASRICGVPVAGITFLTENRLWFKSTIGCTIYEIPRHLSFCQHILQHSANVLEVPDVKLDERFQNKDFKTAFRYYAGAPLITPEGEILGTLCVMHYEPWLLSAQQKEDLTILAKQIITLLELRRTTALLTLRQEDLQQKVNEQSLELNRLVNTFKAIFDHADMAIALTDTFGIIQQVNPALEKLTGYSAAELVGKVTPGALREPTNLHELAQALREEVPAESTSDDSAIINFVQKKGPIHRENIILHKDGRRIPVLSTVSGIYDGSKLIGYIDFALDISTQKQAEKEAREAHEWLEVATKTIKLGIWETDLVTQRITYSEQVLDIFGQTAESFGNLFDSFVRIIHPDDLHVINAVSSGIEAEEETFDSEFRILRLDGQIRHIHSKGVYIKNETGKAVKLIGFCWDITPLKQAQTALNQSQERFERLVNELQEVVFQIDAEGTLLFLNKTWTALSAYTVEESLRSSIFDYIAPGQQGAFRHLLMSLFRGKLASGNQTVQFITRNGDIRWTEVVVKVQNTQENIPVVVQGTLRDITKQKLAEDALRESENRFRAIFNSTFQFLSLLDTNGTVLEINNTAAKASGLPIENFIGKPFWETYWWQISEEARQRLRIAIQQAVNGEEVRYETDVWAANEQVLTIDFSIKPIFDEKGNVQLLIPEGHDISNIKKAQKDLEEAQQRFREIADNVDSIFWVHASSENRYLYVSPAFERITGKSPDRLYDDSRVMLDFVLEEDRPSMKAWLKELSVTPTNHKFRAIDKSGNVLWFESRTFPVLDEQGQPLRWIGVSTNITAEEEKKAVLEHALQHEQEINALKSRFVLMVSHEFRTPMATIMSGADIVNLISEKVHDDRLANQLSQQSRKISQQIQRLESLIEKVLVYERIQEGNLEVRPQTFDLIVFCAEIIERSRERRPENSRILFKSAENSLMVTLDPLLLEHCFENLLSNALKYSSPEDGSVEVELTLSSQKVYLSVTDHGMGIPAKDLQWISNRFFRASNVSRIPGTGVGLSLVQKFMEVIGGTLSIESEESRYTRCVLEMPLVTNETLFS